MNAVYTTGPRARKEKNLDCVKLMKYAVSMSPSIAAVPKPYHHGDLPQACVKVGLDVLKEVGLEKFSLREVARRVGVSATALYHHFPDKEDLVLEVARVGLREFHDHLNLVRPGVPADPLVQLGTNYVHFFVAKPYYLDILFRPDSKSDPEMHEIWQGTFRRLEANLISRGLDPEKAPYFGLWLWTGVHGLATMLRDGILGRPDLCGPDSPEVFQISGDDLLRRVIPLVTFVLDQAAKK